jgi:hypothetical protein
LLKTTTWLPARNMSRGQPSIFRLAVSAIACGGQEEIRCSIPPASTAMRVPSFWTKSASFPPAPGVLVVLTLVGPALSPPGAAVTGPGAPTGPPPLPM